jgi:acetyltransferase
MNAKVTDESCAAYVEDIQPVEWTDAWHLKDGTRILLRPVKPQDSPLLSAMMARLSSQTKYNRFHGTVNNLTSTHLRYLSCVDQQRHVAFVLTTHQNGEEHIIADARYVVDEDANAESAEFAIMVEDHWQRFGLAKHAMQALTTAASNNGLRWLHGDVLAGNSPMLALMEQCHFCCTPDRSDEKMVHAEILLSATDQMSSTKSNTLNTVRHFLLQCVKLTRRFVHQQRHGRRYA